MKPLTFCFSLTLLFFFACKNDDDIPGTGDPDPVYFPLSIGSYWVYDWYMVDTLGNEIKMNYRDSIYVIGTTLSNGFEYQMVSTTFLGQNRKTELLRDSSGYLVNEKGKIFFASNNTTDLLFADTTFIDDEPFMIIEYRMEGATTEIEVPVGTFECLNYQGRVFPQEDDHPWGIRDFKNYYSNGVGKIKTVAFFYYSPNILESRLVNYHIN